jgi:hypothetical protein
MANETGKTITPAQRVAIQTLLTTGSTLDAAAAAGVSRATLYRWQIDPVFILALREAESAATEGLARSLAGLGEAAAAALRDALSATQTISVRLRASEIVIGNLLKLRELVLLEERIATLESNALLSATEGKQDEGHQN